jgi:hypothetical protein
MNEDELLNQISELSDALEAAERTAARQQEIIDILRGRESERSALASVELDHVSSFIRNISLLFCGDFNAIQIQITSNK